MIARHHDDYLAVYPREGIACDTRDLHRQGLKSAKAASGLGELLLPTEGLLLRRRIERRNGQNGFKDVSHVMLLLLDSVHRLSGLAL
jgi:hypothetical protein